MHNGAICVPKLSIEKSATSAWRFLCWCIDFIEQTKTLSSSWKLKSFSPLTICCWRGQGWWVGTKMKTGSWDKLCWWELRKNYLRTASWENLSWWRSTIALNIMTVIYDDADDSSLWRGSYVVNTHTLSQNSAPLKCYIYMDDLTCDMYEWVACILQMHFGNISNQLDICAL